MDSNSLSHTKWNCKYHIVFTPKFRRKVISVTRIEYIKKTIFIANVTFEPGCRNNWHIHHATKGGGQILLCVDGEGWYPEEGKSARSLNPGDVVTIPAKTKHWNGAEADSWFSHLAIECPGENTTTEWRKNLCFNCIYRPKRIISVIYFL